MPGITGIEIVLVGRDLVDPPTHGQEQLFLPAQALLS